MSNIKVTRDGYFFLRTYDCAKGECNGRESETPVVRVDSGRRIVKA